MPPSAWRAAQPASPSLPTRRSSDLLLAEYDPTGLVVSPEMFEKIEVEEDDNGAFRVAVSVAVGAEKRIWRVNVVETTAMTNANFLLDRKSTRLNSSHVKISYAALCLACRAARFAVAPYTPLFRSAPRGVRPDRPRRLARDV